MKKLPVVLMTALVLGGCVNLGLGTDRGAPEIVTYVLEDAGHASPAAGANPRTLLVLGTSASAFYDTDGIAFSRAPGTRGQYQYARWTDRPGKRLGDLLLLRLAAEQSFTAVAAAGSGVKGDWVLDTELLAFYHDAATPPGTARAVLRAEVVDIRNRTLVARRVFEQSVPAQGYNAQGAVHAFNLAATRLLDEVTAWLRTLPGEAGGARK